MSSGDVSIGPDSPKPRPLREDEIQTCIEEFRDAALNAVKAGFEGVELHGANGYLPDQQDQWGGSVKKRSRFPVAVAKAVSEAIGPERVGYRISPWSRHHGMHMENPIPQFTDLLGKLKELRLGYLHIIEKSVEFAADVWGDTSPIISAGGYNTQTSRSKVDEEKEKGRESLVAFGRTSVSNTDLPIRVKELLPVTKYIRDLFYEVGPKEGHVDYPLLEGGGASETTNKEHVWPTGLPSAILQ
ncbi:Fc.00g109550.m01.CDS01 [Cosmosporella sp. VM-42]